MKIWIAQINTKLGDLNHNYNKIINAIDKIWNEAEVLVFPEMTLPWYPLHDKIYDQNLLKNQTDKISQIQKYISDTASNLTVVLWYVDFDKDNLWPDGRWIKHNSAAVITKDQILKYHKQLLPNYDVFYDKRYYQEGKDSLHFPVGDKTATVVICEDMRDEWYDVKPIADAVAAAKTDLIINISSSPFATGKLQRRYDIIKNHATTHHIPMVYVNQVWAQDGNVNDWASMVVDQDGKLIYISPSFEEDLIVIDVGAIINRPDTENDQKTNNNKSDNSSNIKNIYISDIIWPDKLDPKTRWIAPLLDAKTNKYGQMLDAIKLAVRDYADKTGIDNMTIGVSGGIDSALNLYILAQVLPADKIHAYYLPSRHSQSLEYVQKLCDNLGVKFASHDIQPAVSSAISEYEKIHWVSTMDDITYQNIQARERWQILNMYANYHHGLLVNNSNRTEIAQWYATLYGDTVGFLALIWDLIKTEVYEMCEYINTKHGYDIIPNGIITRDASAELTDNQVDPFDYVRESMAIEDIFLGEDIYIVAERYNLPIETVAKYKKRNDFSEFKRVQSPRVVKLKSQSAGMGRIYPIVFG